MDYICQQCMGKATVQGTQAIDQYESPYIAEYVICDDTVCGYTISKDAADCANLLATCKTALEQLEMDARIIAKHTTGYGPAQVCNAQAKVKLQTAIARAEQN